ncbi:ABC transporter substrate-binding protein [Acidisphaera sp. L21]|uniref:ABC transporter substrate-binding protein n=1 Tax=Acidisphaera sp. L21 TaxID=1641851 RepID=UPI001C20429E|nr:extracellular solute-binding protein [Acidisphaera sp. L21]
MLRGAGVGLLATPAILGRARAASSNVTLYSSVPSTYLTKLAEQFNVANPGVTLNVFSAGTFQVYQRLTAELQANRLNADLFQVSDISSFVELKTAGALLPYESETYAHYPDGFKDPQFTWVNSRSLATIFAYNSRAIAAADAPKTWDDYADAKWAGKQGNADPRVDGDALNWYYSLRQAKGVAFWKKYARNKPQIFRGHGAMTDQLVAGALPVTEQLDYIVYTARRDKQAPITPVYPEAVSITMTPLGILKQAPNPAGAKLVFDWLLSKQGQTTLSEINGIYSLRDDVTPLPGKPAFSSLNVVKIDPVDFAKNREAMQDEFVEVFGL